MPKKGKRKGGLTTAELLHYLVRPLHLPPFGSPATFERSINGSINRLLIEAAEEDILPSKVTGVQFIFAKRHKHIAKKIDEDVRGNFTYPLLLSCENRADAANIADGMAYVTDLLMRHGSSFHERVRKFGLTDSPAVCVFSASQFLGSTDPDNKSTNVVWVTLPAELYTASSSRYSPDNLQELDEQVSGRNFYVADLNATIQGGQYRDDLPAGPFEPRTKVVATSETTIRSQKDLLFQLLADLRQDSAYLRRVAYLLQFGDIILCTPHAYNTQAWLAGSVDKVHDVITDAGLTVVLDREKGPITEEDWIRVQVVAQKLAIFAGAAVSTATEARENVFQVLNDVFAHDFSNASQKIVAYLDDLSRANQPITSISVNDIEGRLHFTQNLIDSAMSFYKWHNESIGRLLDTLIGPMRKYHDAVVHEPDYGELARYQVVSLWKLALAEALRNAYKHGQPSPEDGKCHIHVTHQVDGRYVTVSIMNQATRRFALDPNREGWGLIQVIAHSCGGVVSVGGPEGLFAVNLTMPLTKRASSHA